MITAAFLVIVIYGGFGVATSTVPFDDIDSCNQAKTEALKHFDSTFVDVEAICVVDR